MHQLRGCLLNASTHCAWGSPLSNMGGPILMYSLFKPPTWALTTRTFKPTYQEGKAGPTPQHRVLCWDRL